MTHQRAGENGQQGDWPRIEKAKHGEEDNTHTTRSTRANLKD